MELLQELFVTGFLAVVFSFLVAKLVAIATSSEDHSTKRAVSTTEVADMSDELIAADELRFREKLEVEGSTIEDVTEPRGESLNEIVEKFLAEEVPVEPVAQDDFSIAEKVKKEKEQGAVSEEIKERRVEIEDDWEGIERSELEKAFMEAVRSVEAGERGEGVELELYGLHKVATEGPCRENPPLLLKLSARAKCDGGHWLHCARNAWQRLGNMSPEVAMEQYVALVSDKIPAKITREVVLSSSEAADSSVLDSDSSAVPLHESKVADNRNPELEPGTNKTDILTAETSAQNRVKE